MHVPLKPASTAVSTSAAVRSFFQAVPYIIGGMRTPPPAAAAEPTAAPPAAAIAAGFTLLPLILLLLLLVYLLLLLLLLLAVLCCCCCHCQGVVPMLSYRLPMQARCRPAALEGMKLASNTREVAIRSR
jgi:fatty acid desaturase